MDDEGAPYALAFVAAQQRLQAGEPLPAWTAATPPRTWPWDWLAVAAFMLLAAPVLLAGRYAGGKADARNTVSFFRAIGGTVAAVPWLPCLLLAGFRWPLTMSVWSMLGVWGWWRWPKVMHGENA
jgi:hypothetical protein